MRGSPFSLRVNIQEDEETEIPSIRQTLVFLRWNGNVLLIRNKKSGVITGIGGSLDPGETPYDTTARCLIEYGLNCRKLKLLGLIELDLNNGKRKFHVHILTSNVFFGILKDTKEYLPIWVRCTNIPYNKMPEDYRMWLPLLFQGLTFKGAFRNRNKRMVTKYKLCVVYRGPHRNRSKKFGRPPCYKWHGLEPDDSIDIADVLLEGKSKDQNVIDKLSSDDKTALVEDIDVFCEEPSFPTFDIGSTQDELQSKDDTLEM